MRLEGKIESRSVLRRTEIMKRREKAMQARKEELEGSQSPDQAEVLDK